MHKLYEFPETIDLFFIRVMHISTCFTDFNSGSESTLLFMILEVGIQEYMIAGGILMIIAGITLHLTLMDDISNCCSILGM